MLPEKSFRLVENTSKFNKDFIENYNEDSDEGYFFEGDAQNSKKLHDLHNGLLFLLERMKIKNIGKLVANLHDKKENVIHIRNLKKALNHRLALKKMHRDIKFIRKA